ncbi:sensor histidine kinase [Pararhizobium mangrovi]|uniref:sensor histidine kinase n=1 Tax=Pararhizobium mangrovi TaxID=2590452 RepID=UPI0015E82D03|nr:ATP-binding protein [Pararhizobium mangrovi]
MLGSFFSMRDDNSADDKLLLTLAASFHTTDVDDDYGRRRSASSSMGNIYSNISYRWGNEETDGPLDECVADEQAAPDTSLNQACARLARDLHDQAGQYLVAASFQLAAIERRVSDETLLSSLADLRSTLDRFSGEISDLARGRQLKVANRLNLHRLLLDLLKQWQKRTDITVLLDVDRSRCISITDRIAETIFRVVQEALTNVAKHASDASYVRISLSQKDDHIILAIEDDGPGLSDRPVVQRYRRAGSGLLGMRERAKEIGGQLRVFGELGKGTRLSFVFPAPTPKHEEG